MDQKIMIAGVVVLVVIAASIYLLQEKPEKPTPEENRNREDNLKIKYRALLEGNVSICYSLEDAEIRNDCLQAIAEKTENASLCELLEKDYKHYNISIQFCYSNIAKITKNPRLCERIESDKDRDWCYRYVAGINNPFLCENISEISKRNMCYMSIASTSRNLSLCEFIKVLGSKPCLNFSEDNVLYDLSVCMEACLSRTMQVMDDPDLCNTLQNPEIREGCIQFYAYLKKNITLCKKLTDDDEKYRCIAQTTNNITQCGFIEGERKKFGCYSIIERAVGDVSICEQHTNETQRYACYSNIAFDKMDKNLCNLIKDKEKKETCIENIAYYT